MICKCSPLKGINVTFILLFKTCLLLHVFCHRARRNPNASVQQLLHFNLNNEAVMQSEKHAHTSELMFGEGFLTCFSSFS